MARSRGKKVITTMWLRTGALVVSTVACVIPADRAVKSDAMRDLDCKNVIVGRFHEWPICEFSDDCPAAVVHAYGCNRVVEYDVGRLSGPKRVGPVQSCDDREREEREAAKQYP